jgi:hypothetical protein
MWAVDKIVIVRGKVDVRNGRVSVLADSVQDYVEGAKVLEDINSVGYRYRTGPTPALRNEPAAAKQPLPVGAPPTNERQTPRQGRWSYGSAMPPTAYAGEDDSDEGAAMAFVDENPFAGREPDWFEPASSAIPAEPVSEGMLDPEKAGGGEEAQAMQESFALLLTPPQVQPSAAAPISAPLRVSAPVAAPADPASSFSQTPSRFPPAPNAGAGVGPGQLPASGPPIPSRKTVRINFRRSQSLDADRKRLNDLVELLSSFEGEDRFEITLLANGKARYQLEFPNNTTRVCRELKAALMQRLGSGGWQVED